MGRIVVSGCFGTQDEKRDETQTTVVSNFIFAKVSTAIKIYKADSARQGMKYFSASMVHP
jgi:hypothetical protein